MFFEGPEKKVEVIVKQSCSSLRQLPRSVWQEVVSKAKACILSEISNEKCDAYLLSESSLFVYEDHFVMITCGTTTLVDAVMEFLKTVPIQEIEVIIYERKNEHFPHYQQSSFFEDVGRLQEIVPGQAWQFGDEDNHHLFLFQTKNNYKPVDEDFTLEILMHGIQGPAKEVLGSSQSSRQDVDQLKMAEIFPDFQVDDHIFEPYGYSLNAIKENWYYTIHVTPEELGSYVSFETNFVRSDHLQGVIHRVLEIFQPESCDVIVFHKDKQNIEGLKGYRLRSHVEQNLEGYQVSFKHFYQPPEGPRSAQKI